MASRIFWIALAGIALVTGMIMHGGLMFGGGDHDGISERTERAIEARVERAVERSVDAVPVVRVNGRQIEDSAEARRALGDAIRRLAKAEAQLAVLGIRDAKDEQIQAATIRRDQARTEVETLKAQSEQQKDVSDAERAAIREEIRRGIRDDVRDTVRDVVGN